MALAGIWGILSYCGEMKLAHALPRTRGQPCGIRQPDGSGTRRVMTALPKAAYIIPANRGAWQIGWISMQSSIL